MDVQIHRATEALKHRDAAAPGMRDAMRLGPRAQMAFDGLVQDARNPSAQVVTPRQQVAQPMREREHPLSYGNVGEDVVDEMRGAFGHAPPATTRTEPAPFTGERHEPLGRAVPATEPREAPGQEATPQERPELVFHEPGEAMAVARPRGVVEEVLDVIPYHCVDGGGTRIARRVLEGGHAPLGADDMPQRERPECWAERRLGVATRRCCVLGRANRWHEPKSTRSARNLHSSRQASAVGLASGHPADPGPPRLAGTIHTDFGRRQRFPEPLRSLSALGARQTPRSVRAPTCDRDNSGTIRSSEACP